MTVYVKRNQDKAILAVSRERLSDEWEAVGGDAPEVKAFAAVLADGQQELATTDLGLVRVVEDLVDLLIERDLIRFTDLSPAAQGKLFARRTLRNSLSSLHLLEDYIVKDPG